jgi:phage-related holin
MKEDFLHYLWKNKKFNITNLKTTDEEEIVILNSGMYLQKEGPDFFNAQLIIGNQKWAGNVEIHLKSSDWYLHHHEEDGNYENVILHVVWEHDSEIFRKNNTKIPVLELKNLISIHDIEKYLQLTKIKSWTYCENELKDVDDFILGKWQERLYLERLENKIIPIEKFLSKNENDWEASLFAFLLKGFGLNINGEVFFKIANAIPFSVIRKERFDLQNLEALLFGFANLLNSKHEDVYYNELQKKWNYLKIKYKLEENLFETVHFFKLRPDNFPTIRLAQMAMLYHLHDNLFTKIISIKKCSDFYNLFKVEVSDYWKEHYVFDMKSKTKQKRFTKQFIDLLIVNVFVPIQFVYEKKQGNDVLENCIAVLNEIPSESNAIISKFSSFGVKVDSAFNSQALLQLKNEYCNHKKCLNCDIGLSLLKY